MNELSKLLQENLNIDFISATLSNPKNKDGVQKVKVRPVLKKDVLYFQLESFRNNQAFHDNVEEKKACEILLEYMGKDKMLVVLALVFVFVFSGATLAGSYMLKPIVDQLGKTALQVASLKNKNLDFSTVLAEKVSIRCNPFADGR